MQSDEEFRRTLHEIRAGNQSALNSMLESWRSVIRVNAHGMLGGRLPPRADSSDLVQETLIQAFEDFGNFRGKTKGEWMSWLRSILVAKANYLRKFHAAEKRAPSMEVRAAPQVADTGPDPAMAALLQERISQVTAAMNTLPTPMYEVLFRRFFLRQPFADVAQALDRSPGATRVLLVRAVRRLHEQITAMSSESDLAPSPQPPGEPPP